MGFFRNKTKYIGDSRRFNFRFDLYVYGKHFDFVCVYFQGFILYTFQYYIILED